MSARIIRYEKNPRHCRKCGNADRASWAVIYLPAFREAVPYRYENPLSGPVPDPIRSCTPGLCPEGEHLHVRCKCGFVGVAPCEDAEALGAPRPPAPPPAPENTQCPPRVGPWLRTRIAQLFHVKQKRNSTGVSANG